MLDPSFWQFALMMGLVFCVDFRLLLCYHKNIKLTEYMYKGQILILGGNMGSTKILISIIIPVYNVEKYLGECLDTVLKQDIPSSEYEIICINDGSTDNSGDILNEYANTYKNIRVINKSNGGVSSARNMGIDSAKGEYIWFIDSDDIISYNVLSKIKAELNEQKPDLMFVKPIAFNDGEDTEIYKTGSAKEDETTKKYGDWLWTRLIKSSIIRNSGVYFNTNISLAEDHMFCTMLNPYINNITTSDILAYYYRLRENSASTTAAALKIDSLIKSAEAFHESGINNIIDYNVAMKTVYDIMIPIMYAISAMPKKQANHKIQYLKKLNLFPLTKINSLIPKPNTDGLTFTNKTLLKLKFESFTKVGYYKLKLFRFMVKIKRRLIK